MTDPTTPSTPEEPTAAAPAEPTVPATPVEPVVPVAEPVAPAPLRGSCRSRSRPLRRPGALRRPTRDAAPAAAPGYAPGAPVKQTLAIVSFILGILGVLLAFAYGFGLIPGIVAVILGFQSKKKEPPHRAGCRSPASSPVSWRSASASSSASSRSCGLIAYFAILNSYPYTG